MTEASDMRRPTNVPDGDSGDVAFCEECLLGGTESIVLRICLRCGHIGCAEGSPDDHAAGHYAETDHPIAAAMGSTGKARRCYPEERSI